MKQLMIWLMALCLMGCKSIKTSAKVEERPRVPSPPTVRVAETPSAVIATDDEKWAEYKNPKRLFFGRYMEDNRWITIK